VRRRRRGLLYKLCGPCAVWRHVPSSRTCAYGITPPLCNRSKRRRTTQKRLMLALYTEKSTHSARVGAPSQSSARSWASSVRAAV